MRHRIALAVAFLAAGIAASIPAIAAGKVALLCTTCSPRAAEEYRQEMLAAFGKQGLREGRDFELVTVRPDGQREFRAQELRSRIASVGPAVVLPMDVRSNTVIVEITNVPVVVGAAYADAGLVGARSRPEGNITGFVYGGENLDVKRLELLRELLPGRERVAVWVQPDLTNLPDRLAQLRAAAARLGLRLQEYRASSDDDEVIAERRFKSMVAAREEALLVLAGNLWTRKYVKLANQYRLPSVYPYAWTAREGGLCAYQQAWWDYADVVGYAARILRGSRPQDLPVQQQDRIEFVLNPQTALELGVAFPPAMTVRATQVIGR